MAKFNENSSIGVTGHVLMTDADTGEVILDKYNAINSENMAYIVSNLLSGAITTTDAITNLDYGIGGTTVDTIGNITYKEPRVDGEARTGLYEWALDVNEEGVTSDISAATSEDNIVVIPHNSYPYSDIVVTATLGYSGTNVSDISTLQSPDDTATYTDGSFVFDEIALRTGSNKYLTHLIFHPIQKSANRKIVIKYTLRIRVGS